MDSKPIPKFSKYSATKCGKILNKNGLVLKDYDTNGYRNISLINDLGNRQGVGVHRLIASAWLGEIPQGYWVNHENGIKHDNRLENLRIDTPSYNHRHAHDVLKRRTKRNEDRYEAIRILIDLGWSQHRLSRAFECSQSNISQILSTPRKP